MKLSENVKRRLDKNYYQSVYIIQCDVLIREQMTKVNRILWQDIPDHTRKA